MTKSASQIKTRRAQTGPRLTEPEVDAALQLIQLSGDSTDSKFGNGGGAFDKEEEESVGNTTGSTADEISSAMKINSRIIDDNLDDEACPPRQRKFRYIHDLYMNTRPLIKKPGKKARKM